MHPALDRPASAAAINRRWSCAGIPAGFAEQTEKDLQDWQATVTGDQVRTENVLQRI
jgi:hypothetical protein